MAPSLSKPQQVSNLAKIDTFVNSLCKESSNCQAAFQSAPIIPIVVGAIALFGASFMLGVLTSGTSKTKTQMIQEVNNVISNSFNTVINQEVINDQDARNWARQTIGGVIICDNPEGECIINYNQTMNQSVAMQSILKQNLNADFFNRAMNQIKVDLERRMAQVSDFIEQLIKKLGVTEDEMRQTINNKFCNDVCTVLNVRNLNRQSVRQRGDQSAIIDVICKAKKCVVTTDQQLTQNTLLSTISEQMSNVLIRNDFINDVDIRNRSSTTTISLTGFIIVAVAIIVIIILLLYVYYAVL